MPTLPDDDREPVAVRRARVSAAVALWDGHVKYERMIRRIDQAAVAEAAAAARVGPDADAAFEAAQRAKRRRTSHG